MSELKTFEMRVYVDRPSGGRTLIKTRIDAETSFQAKELAEAQYGRGQVVGYPTEIKRPKPPPQKPSPTPRRSEPQQQSGTHYTVGGDGTVLGGCSKVIRDATMFVVVIVVAMFVVAHKQSAPTTPTPTPSTAPAPAPTIVPEPPADPQDAQQPVDTTPPVRLDRTGQPLDPGMSEPPEPIEQRQPVPRETPPPPPPPALETYYAEVRHADGRVETIDLVAPNAKRAREIIREHRGDPDVIAGPSTEKTW